MRELKIAKEFYQKIEYGDKRNRYRNPLIKRAQKHPLKKRIKKRDKKFGSGENKGLSLQPQTGKPVTAKPQK